MEYEFIRALNLMSTLHFAGVANMLLHTDFYANHGKYVSHKFTRCLQQLGMVLMPIELVAKVFWEIIENQSLGMIFLRCSVALSELNGHKKRFN